MNLSDIEDLENKETEIKVLIGGLTSIYVTVNSSSSNNSLDFFGRDGGFVALSRQRKESLIDKIALLKNKDRLNKLLESQRERVKSEIKEIETSLSDKLEDIRKAREKDIKQEPLNDMEIDLLTYASMLMILRNNCETLLEYILIPNQHIDRDIKEEKKNPSNYSFIKHDTLRKLYTEFNEDKVLWETWREIDFIACFDMANKPNKNQFPQFKGKGGSSEQRFVSFLLHMEELTKQKDLWNEKKVLSQFGIKGYKAKKNRTGSYPFDDTIKKRINTLIRVSGDSDNFF